MTYTVRTGREIRLYMLRSALQYINEGIADGDLGGLSVERKHRSSITPLLWAIRIHRGTPHAAALSEGGRCVGLCHVDGERGRRDVNGYLAITVSREYRSNGIGERLLRAIEVESRRVGMCRLTAEPSAANQGAVRFLLKHGYEYEGTMRYGIRTPSGRVVDRLVLGKLLTTE